MSLTLLGLVTLITSCAGPPTKPLPSFSPIAGPWGSAFNQLLRENLSPFERAALSDGQISDQEYAEAKTRYKRCVEATGITIQEMRPDGGVSYHFPPSMDSKEAFAQEDKCSKSSGEQTVASMYQQMQRNPRNLNESEITAACLVRAGAVPPSYKPSDWDRDSERGTGAVARDFPGKSQVDQCESDPLGLVR